ncbi:hypothetical protein GO755_22595 [Spirosoma sp. HMF4905]|uniref:Uncharacterized protein n=1 Tax=Spirosoma arboris TaxID=2682092 RepID=A0A7K1SGX6_9BACT|nr:hypothetical protein [Spirosoma arboris]MVM32846.1 hypothetical protein [Spirosoma arboris]
MTNKETTKSLRAKAGSIADEAANSLYETLLTEGFEVDDDFVVNELEQLIQEELNEFPDNFQHRQSR